MAKTPLKVLLFVAGVLFAGFGTAYLAGLFDPAAEPVVEARIPEAPEATPSGNTASQEGQAPTISSQSGEQRQEDAGETADLQARSTGTGVDVIVPSFDLLRAERDGSLVVAGRVAPGAEVQVLSGSSVLATSEAGPSGDFAAVLDEPLEPGEHNIVLRSTSSDNVVATSLETAIVSIPSDESGQVVALVQQPGEPSRLITAPSADSAGGNSETQQATVQETAPGEPEESAPRANASAEGAETGAEEAGSDTSQPAPGEETVDTERQQTAGEPQAGEASDAGAQVAEAETEPSAAGADEYAAPTEKAAPSSSQETPTAQSESGLQPFIEAVEIDGREVFVAGSAEPGRRLNVYANDILLGQATVSPDGRFLVEAERELPVGDYIIRADVLADDGVTVIARAAVPFERHQGNNIAAVAPKATARLSLPAGSVETGETSSDSAQAPASRNGVSDAPAPAAPQQETDAAETTTSPQGNGDAGISAGSSGSGDVAEVVSPPLETADGAVIIRRGDTLWEISRRVYGRGTRYTTIYLANQDQIQNPDRIWPGQTFVLPEKTEQGETADLDAISERTE